jgi:hypothetical protein
MRQKNRIFYLERLGQALAYLFSQGAPISKTLVDIKEVYPKIFVSLNQTY